VNPKRVSVEAFEEAKVTFFRVFQQYRLAHVVLNIVPYIGLKSMVQSKRQSVVWLSCGRRGAGSRDLEWLASTRLVRTLRWTPPCGTFVRQSEAIPNEPCGSSTRNTAFRF
jgi:hypothetical protein